MPLYCGEERRRLRRVACVYAGNVVVHLALVPSHPPPHRSTRAVIAVFPAVGVGVTIFIDKGRRTLTMTLLGLLKKPRLEFVSSTGNG